MPLDAAFSFLTYPKRNDPDEPLAPGAAVAIDQENKLVRMLNDLFAKAARDCVVPITFRSDTDDQTNEVRSEILALLEDPSVETASPLALRLQRTTGGASGMGLMFICLGRDGEQSRVLISRFPADEGVVAERNDAALMVQFVDQVFLKNAHAYKAATFLTNGAPDQLWEGHIVDRQLGGIAEYWMYSFLKAEETTTPANGTKRLAKALRKAVGKTGSAQVKQEIAAAAQLAANIPERRRLTIAGFCDLFHFSEDTKAEVVACIEKARLVNDSFRFDRAEFEKHLAYRQVELDNGAVLTAPADRFDEIYERHRRRGGGETFSTTGEIVDQKLKKSK